MSVGHKRVDSALELVFLLINIIPIDNSFEWLVKRPYFHEGRFVLKSPTREVKPGRIELAPVLLLRQTGSRGRLMPEILAPTGIIIREISVLLVYILSIDIKLVACYFKRGSNNFFVQLRYGAWTPMRTFADFENR